MKMSSAVVTLAIHCSSTKARMPGAAMWTDMPLCMPTCQKASAKQTEGRGAQIRWCKQVVVETGLSGWMGYKPAGVFVGLNTEVSSCVHSEIKIHSAYRRCFLPVNVNQSRTIWMPSKCNASYEEGHWDSVCALRGFCAEQRHRTEVCSFFCGLQSVERAQASVLLMLSSCCVCVCVCERERERLCVCVSLTKTHNLMYLYHVLLRVQSCQSGMTGKGFL